MIGDRPCPYYMLHTMKNLKSQTLQLLSEKRWLIFKRVGRDLAMVRVYSVAVLNQEKQGLVWQDSWERNVPDTSRKRKCRYLRTKSV